MDSSRTPLKLSIAKAIDHANARPGPKPAHQPSTSPCSLSRRRRLAAGPPSLPLGWRLGPCPTAKRSATAASATFPAASAATLQPKRTAATQCRARTHRPRRAPRSGRLWTPARCTRHRPLLPPRRHLRCALPTIGLQRTPTYPRSCHPDAAAQARHPGHHPLCHRDPTRARGLHLCLRRRLPLIPPSLTFLGHTARVTPLSPSPARLTFLTTLRNLLRPLARLGQAQGPFFDPSPSLRQFCV